MKAKPDLTSFRPPAKDPTEFLEAGAGDRAERPSAKPTKPVEAAKPEPTVQKLFRLPWDSAQALKRGALDESESQGVRVTETEIIDAMIRERYRLPKRR